MGSVRGSGADTAPTAVGAGRPRVANGSSLAETSRASGGKDAPNTATDAGRMPKYWDYIRVEELLALQAGLVERLVEATADLRVGDPSEPRTQVGPLIDPAGW